jgi:hypothetical protein
VYRLLGLGDCQQHSGEDRLHGETACGAARVPRVSSRRDSRAAAHRETAALRLTVRQRGHPSPQAPHGRTAARPQREMAARPPPGETVHGGSRLQLTERQTRGAGRWRRAVPARRDGRTPGARSLPGRTGETAARRDGRRRAVAARRDGRTARRPPARGGCAARRPRGGCHTEDRGVRLMPSGPRERRRGRGESDSRYHFRRKSNTPSSILKFNRWVSSQH